MIWFLIFLIIVIFVCKALFDISFDFQKDHGVIWYSFKRIRRGFILWGFKY